MNFSKETDNIEMSERYTRDLTNHRDQSSGAIKIAFYLKNLGMS